MGKYNVGDYYFFKVAEPNTLKFYTGKIIHVDDIDLKVLTLYKEKPIIKIRLIVVANELIGAELKDAKKRIAEIEKEAA